MKKLLFLSLIVMWLGAAWPLANAQQSDPITLRLEGSPPTNLDPVSAISVNDIEAILNMFLTLVRVSPTEIQALEPSLATRWSVSADGLVYTFTLREDVPWVRYNMIRGQVEKMRNVTAADVVYGIQRACRTLANGYYAANVFGPVIEGCKLALDGRDPAEVVGVRAVDEFTVEIRLTAPGDYFISMATLWTIAPVPQEVVEDFGSAWTFLGNMWSNGPYVLVQNTGTNTVYHRNPFFPADLGGGGNAEVVQVQEYSFDDFQAGRADRVNSAPNDFIRTNPDQVFEFLRSFVFYIGISNDKAPLDNPGVRRALAAALDRQEIIKRAFGADSWEATPMQHFAPEILFGGLPPTAAGIGYDLEFAQQQLAEAGYPNCEGMPTLYFSSIDISFTIREYLIEQFQKLGCTDFDVDSLGNSTDAEDRIPVDERPHFWQAAWAADYPDADNYMSLLACGVNNSFRKSCTEVDDLIRQARQSLDPNERIALYQRLQDLLFGREGEFPMIPLYRQNEIRVVQPWLRGPHSTNGVSGADRYDFYTIVTEAEPIVADNPTPTPMVTPITTPTLTPEVPPTAEPTPTPEPTAIAESTPAGPTPPPVTTADNNVGQDCRILTQFRVNLRAGPGTDYERLRVLPIFNRFVVMGYNENADGFRWWQLESGGWVRGDLVQAEGSCAE